MAWSSVREHAAPEEGPPPVQGGPSRGPVVDEELLPVDAVDHGAGRVRRVRVPRRPPRVAVVSSPASSSFQRQLSPGFSLIIALRSFIKKN